MLSKKLTDLRKKKKMLDEKILQLFKQEVPRNIRMKSNLIRTNFIIIERSIKDEQFQQAYNLIINIE